MHWKQCNYQNQNKTQSSLELHIKMNVKHCMCAKNKYPAKNTVNSTLCCSVKILVVRVCRSYLVDNELMGAIWQSPAILLHQRNKGVAKQFLLSLVFSCQTTTHGHGIESKIHQHRLRENKHNKSSYYETSSASQIMQYKLLSWTGGSDAQPSVHLFYLKCRPCTYKRAGDTMVDGFAWFHWSTMEEQCISKRQRRRLQASRRGCKKFGFL